MSNNIRAAIAALWGHTIDAAASASTLHQFVVTNDWAEALAGAEGFSREEADFRLPYDACAFDFNTLGMIVLTLPIEVGEEVRCLDGNVYKVTKNDEAAWCVLLKRGGAWAFNTDFEQVDKAKERVRAVCVALETGIAEETIVPAPREINARRLRKGKPPLPEYRVVELARRYRHTAKNDTPCRKVRCHFRRGHWRTLEDSRRTWVKWCLVGDPALGFVAHEYNI